jgi:hypothetical protein
MLFGRAQKGRIGSLVWCVNWDGFGQERFEAFSPAGQAPIWNQQNRPFEHVRGHADLS